jgi:hypothetical protein
MEPENRLLGSAATAYTMFELRAAATAVTPSGRPLSLSVQLIRASVVLNRPRFEVAVNATIALSGSTATSYGTPPLPVNVVCADCHADPEFAERMRLV